MYATVRTYAGSEIAAELRRNEETVKRLIGDVPGFRAYYLVESPHSTTSVTVCDDQAGAEESNRVAAGWISENLPELASSPPTISAGEVTISDTA